MPSEFWALLPRTVQMGVASSYSEERGVKMDFHVSLQWIFSLKTFITNCAPKWSTFTVDDLMFSTECWLLEPFPAKLADNVLGWFLYIATCMCRRQNNWSSFLLEVQIWNISAFWQLPLVSAGQKEIKDSIPSPHWSHFSQCYPSSFKIWWSIHGDVNSPHSHWTSMWSFWVIISSSYCIFNWKQAKHKETLEIRYRMYWIW